RVAVDELAGALLESELRFEGASHLHTDGARVVAVTPRRLRQRRIMSTDSIEFARLMPGGRRYPVRVRLHDECFSRRRAPDTLLAIVSRHQLFDGHFDDLGPVEAGVDDDAIVSEKGQAELSAPQSCILARSSIGRFSDLPRRRMSPHTSPISRTRSRTFRIVNVP